MPISDIKIINNDYSDDTILVGYKGTTGWTEMKPKAPKEFTAENTWEILKEWQETDFGGDSGFFYCPYIPIIKEDGDDNA